MNEIFKASKRVAEHCGDIMRNPPGRTQYGIVVGHHVQIITVEIRLRRDLDMAPVWDQVWVDGEWCGNRCGGIDKFSETALGFIRQANDIQNSTTTAKRSEAYAAGYSDGLEWDLDGFESHENVVRERYGWDEATINAIGVSAFAAHVGLPEDYNEDEWEDACEQYNSGAYAGATAKSGRSGLPPGIVDECL